jgi:hypothetical protein
LNPSGWSTAREKLTNFIFGPICSVQESELRDGHPAGYQFQTIGDPEEELLVLLGRLIERMWRGLSVRIAEHH